MGDLVDSVNGMYEQILGEMRYANWWPSDEFSTPTGVRANISINPQPNVKILCLSAVLGSSTALIRATHTGQRQR
jgi:hypothetical protein